MKVDFIRKNGGEKRLILIFAGWSTNPSLYSQIAIEGWDVAVVHDYSEISLSTDFLKPYNTVFLFAWSLGVAAAEAVLPADAITSAYAINGSLNPVSDKFGIPPEIYFGTLDNLSPRNLTKFRMRMAGDNATFKEIFGNEVPDGAEVETLKTQLRNLATANCDSPRLPWRKTFIGEADRIFPPQNLCNSWQRYPEVKIISLSKPHYIPLQEIVASVIPDTAVVGRNFELALDTYNDNAIVQREIATILFSLFLEYTKKWEINIPANPRILEIGPGTGFLTKLYASQFPDAQIDLVDIANIKDIPANAEFHNRDAELWLKECTVHYDLILSSSTIQWFTHHPEAFRQFERILKPGGTIAISTFMQGNMAELDAVRHSPIDYLSADSYTDMLNHFFTRTQVIQDSLTIDFESPREIMMHLKRTGVAGSAPSPRVTLSALRNISKVTYRPLYLLGQKAL